MKIALTQYIMDKLMLKIIEEIVEEIENNPNKTIEEINLINKLSNIALEIINNE